MPKISYKFYSIERLTEVAMDYLHTMVEIELTEERYHSPKYQQARYNYYRALERLGAAITRQVGEPEIPVKRRKAA